MGGDLGHGALDGESAIWAPENWKVYRECPLRPSFPLRTNTLYYSKENQNDCHVPAGRPHGLLTFATAHHTLTLFRNIKYRLSTQHVVKTHRYPRARALAR